MGLDQFSASARAGAGWLSGGKWYVLRTKAVYGRVGTSEAVLSQWRKNKLKLAYLFSIFLSFPYSSIIYFLLLFTLICFALL